MTESKAIMRHIARVYDKTGTLLPNDPKIAYKVDMIECIIVEALMGVGKFAYEYDVRTLSNVYYLARLLICLENISLFE